MTFTKEKFVQFKEDRPSAYNVTLWSVRVTTTVIETQQSSVCIVVYLHAAANNIRPLSVAMETREWVPFALLSSCLIFRTAVTKINILKF